MLFDSPINEPLKGMDTYFIQYDGNKQQKFTYRNGYCNKW